MTTKPGFKDIMWMAAGAVMVLVIMLVVLHFQTGTGPGTGAVEQLAFKTTRADLVAKIRLNLASASEAEKSAVMAITDEDSKKYADQARAAAAEAEQGRKELESLLTAGATQNERDLLAQFSKAFADFQKIDAELLDLAVRNTNLKAYDLAFGPAADTLKDMDSALSRVAAKSTDSPEAASVATLAFGAQTAALRIQTLLAPHIAEESDQKMDALEAQMTQDDQQVRKDLDSLAALPRLHGDADLETATTDYAKFGEIRGRILALSRENTNVRSLAISLDQKRKVLFLCEDALSALQKAIAAEPIRGVNSGFAVNPRSLGEEKPAATK